MKRLRVSCVVAMFAVASVGAMAQDKPAAANQAAKPKVMTATGTVSAIAADTLTVKAASGEMAFTLDAKTSVSGKGLTTKSTELKKEGKPTSVTEFVHVGDRVDV